MNENNNQYPNYNFSDLEPYYTKKKRHSGKFLKKAAKVFGASFLVFAISLATIFGYNSLVPETNTLPDGSKVNGTNTVYLPTSMKDALTIPQIYENTVSSVVAIEANKGGGAYGQTSVGTGTGIVMSEDGYIITNAHVVEGSTSLTVTTFDGKEYQATIVGSDSKADIAVIKVETTGLTAATFGEPLDLVYGEPAVVIGNPLGTNFAGTVTDGIISSTSREVEIGGYIMRLIQTNAAINPGNSGGPLINSRGQVVGVVSSKIAADDVEGIGFAIPIDIALNVANDFIEYGYVKRPMMGITVEQIDPFYAQMYGGKAGLRVASVQDGSAADEAGMFVGDYITKINDKLVSTSADLNYEKDKFTTGDKIKLTVDRDGEELELSLTLKENTAE